jgi:GNAT superfamily N-acetyltransferase
MRDKPCKDDLDANIREIDAAMAGDQSEENLAALKHAVDANWPEIQKHLNEKGRETRKYLTDDDGSEYYIDDNGRKVGVLSLDEWWLKDFDRKDVIMELPGVVIMNTKPWHTSSVCISLRKAYGVGRGDECSDCFTEDDILAHIERFPNGQFAAQRISGPNAGNCVGMAVTMRTARPPTMPILPWLDAIGDLQLSAHEPDGDWLYGVEMAVHPLYQGQGIGAGLYQARFQMARQMNLRGWYAVGMLMGYKQRAADMDVIAYGEQVIAGEILDPTVTMQMNRGFVPKRVVTDYVDEPAAGDAGVLIVWENPGYESE